MAKKMTELGLRHILTDDEARYVQMYRDAYSAIAAYGGLIVGRKLVKLIDSASIGGNKIWSFKRGCARLANSVLPLASAYISSEAMKRLFNGGALIADEILEVKENQGFEYNGEYFNFKWQREDK